MKLKKAVFVVSNTDYKKCPEPDKPEFAFIGRSNVGKSSLINMLAENKNLAKTSSRPGKTQLINHFLIDDSWYLVDLPGYGYAKVSKSLKDTWAPMIRNYILNRENLYCLILLIDSRLPPQKIDMEFINWLGESQIPFVLVFTKTDKQGKVKTQSNVAAFLQKMKEDWDELPQHFLTSALDHSGKDEVISFIQHIVQQNG